MVILEFSEGQINTSAVTENDLVYYVSNVSNTFSGSNLGFGLNESEITSGVSTHVFIGTISSITSVTDSTTDGTDQSAVMSDNAGFVVTTEEPSNTTIVPPAAGDFIFFVKNNLTEMASIKGYYNSVTFENNSTNHAELFSVACGTTVSSK